MKPLYILAAEERLRGQPGRQAKVYKDDISVFEADMLYIRNHLLAKGAQSLGQIAVGTGIPKSTVQKMLSPMGIRRTFNLDQLAKMREKNIKRYFKVVTGYSSVLVDGDGRWQGLEYRESDRERFREWLMRAGYMLLEEKADGGESRYVVIRQPEDVKEELYTTYTHRMLRHGQ